MRTGSRGCCLDLVLIRPVISTMTRHRCVSGGVKDDRAYQRVKRRADVRGLYGEERKKAALPLAFRGLVRRERRNTAFAHCNRRIEALCSVYVVLASRQTKRFCLSDSLLRAGRTEILPIDTDVLFPQSPSHVAPVEPDVAKEMT